MYHDPEVPTDSRESIASRESTDSEELTSYGVPEMKPSIGTSVVPRKFNDLEVQSAHQRQQSAL